MTQHWLVLRTMAVGAAVTMAGCGGDGGGATGGAEQGGTGQTTGAETSGGTTTTAGSADDGVDPTTPADSSSSAGNPWDPPTNFDVATLPDAPPQVCGGKGGGGGGGGGVDLSYIWIANSFQGTISKINTQTIVEEGRYTARPSAGDPSRTSVNLNGDVAVANRNGGVAKFYAREADCQDNNGVPGIQTSSGAGDVLPWGEDDCLAWFLPLACSSNRPVAWTRGTFNEATCSYEDAKLWTVCDDETLLVDGETGVIEETIIAPPGSFVYGGAADADGNFWGLNVGGGNGIYRVDANDYSVLSFPLPPSGGYGITVDKEGRPWVCGGGGASRFNLDDSTWTSTPGGADGIGGCMTDGDSTLWHSNPGGTLLGYDIESLELVNSVPLPEYVHGVSVDFEGYVWGVSFAGSNAYRADPDSGAVDTYNGLTSAYTYSDMTGTGLFFAGGGGVPPS
jgi:hypothetical protein